jgi:hypothetical protein
MEDMTQGVADSQSPVPANHEFHIYTHYYHDPRSLPRSVGVRMYWWECECGMKSGDFTVALICKQNGEQHAPGATQFIPYSS